MEKTLHDVHRERTKRWKDEYPAHIMSMDELKEYVELYTCGKFFTAMEQERFDELSSKYQQLKSYYINKNYESDTN